MTTLINIRVRHLIKYVIVCCINLYMQDREVLKQRGGAGAPPYSSGVGTAGTAGVGGNSIDFGGSGGTVGGGGGGEC